jgi:hypothetical protein
MGHASTVLTFTLCTFGLLDLYASEVRSLVNEE